MDGSSRVLAAFHFDHEQREEQEEDGHGEADAVHGPVAHQHVTVDVAAHTRDRGGHTLFTEAWNLTTGTQVMLLVASEWSTNVSSRVWLQHTHSSARAHFTCDIQY